MAMPKDIDSRALQLLINADWPWDDRTMAFVEPRRPEEESSDKYKRRPRRSIGYGKLRDRGLAGLASSEHRDSGLPWLRGLLERQ
jgi:hypothetical protein